MSYYVEVGVQCDHEDCPHLFRMVRENRGGLNKTWAGYMAASKGWWVRGETGRTDPKVAYCRAHRAEHGHPETES
jgi:hypothetical protein